MPASGQHITGSKADIFTPVNPLGGAATDEDKSIQEAMTEEVDKRMRNAVEDLREKDATGPPRSASLIANASAARLGALPATPLNALATRTPPGGSRCASPRGAGWRATRS